MGYGNTFYSSYLLVIYCYFLPVNLVYQALVLLSGEVDPCLVPRRGELAGEAAQFLLVFLPSGFGSVGGS